MNSGFRVAVDVGNSSFKIATASQPGSLASANLIVNRISVSQNDWQTQLAAVACTFPQTNVSVEWLLASVNSVACQRLQAWITKHRNADRVYLIDRRHIGIETDVRFPERVGIDRLLAARSAFQMSGNQSAIVIDAGTTITVDLVDQQGIFCGGAIMPGIGLQFRSLHEATDKLPRLEPPSDLTNLESPGRDTQSAMCLGVVAGVVGAIDRLVESFQSNNPVAGVFLTGGDTRRLSAAIRSEHRVVVDLPLRGLYELQLSERCDI